MERTESIVIQVTPAYENAKIKEMQLFGWNLQGRQEVHEEGDAYGRPSYLDRTTYLIKTKVYHYVKLHFVRSLSLPNLDKIRELENEYLSLPVPRFPSIVPPGGIIGIIVWLFLWFLWPFYYFLLYKGKKVTAEAQLEEMLRREQDIKQRLAALL